MTPLTPKHLVVDLDYDNEGTIAGRVRDDATGDHADFAGWLGLAAAIERLAAPRKP